MRQCETNRKLSSLSCLTELSCSLCADLHDGCFDRLSNLTRLTCNNVPKITDRAFSHLTALRFLSAVECDALTTLPSHLTALADVRISLLRQPHWQLPSLTNLVSRHENVALTAGMMGGVTALQSLRVPLHSSICQSAFLLQQQLQVLLCSKCFIHTDAFDGLHSLTRLDCCRCQFLQYPLPFSGLTALTDLDCSSCVGLEQGCFSMLESLRKLDISESIIAGPGCLID